MILNKGLNIPNIAKICLIIYFIKTNIDIHSPLQTKSLVIYFPTINKMFQLIVSKKKIVIRYVQRYPISLRSTL